MAHHDHHAAQLDDDRARYHVLNNVHHNPWVVDLYDPCTDDDCPRDHVHVIATDDLDARYVDRPRFHEHPDIDGTGYHHDHHGRAIRHYHHPDAVQYVASDRLIPRGTPDHHD